MSSTALLGFASVGAFLALVLATRTPVIVALLLTPLVAALAGGFGGEIGTFAIEGIKTVAPVAALIMFAILYFGLMIDVGLFEPMIRRMVGIVRNDPVRLCLVSAALPTLVALDGDGSTTFLISVTALLPLHQRMALNPLVLPAIVALAAGVMNILPWGGPAARAMAVLNADVDTIFLPVVPAMLAGLCWVFFAAWCLGVRERKRLAGTPAAFEVVQPTSSALRTAPRMFAFNAALTVLLIVLLFQDLYAESIGLPPLPAPLLFMIAFAIALPINRRGAKAQQEQLASHASSVVFVTSMVLAAGVFTGILNGSGMIKAMAEVLAGAFPEGLVSLAEPVSGDYEYAAEPGVHT